MARIALPAFAALAALTLGLNGARGSEPVTLPPELMNCGIGPIGKIYANAPWRVYSCEDGATLQVVATSLNAAAPFSFTLAPAVHGYRVTSDGPLNGATRKAYRELRGLSGVEISSLIAMTHHHENLEATEAMHLQEAARVVSTPAPSGN